MTRSVSVDYTIEFFDSTFELRFIPGDGFYECDEVYLSVRDFTLEGGNSTFKYLIMRLFCKNLCIPLYDMHLGTKTEYENLALVKLGLQSKNSQQLFPVHSPEVRVPINGRRIEFGLESVFDKKIVLDFEKEVKRAFVRFSVRRVGKNV